MKMSRLVTKSLRDDPPEAESASHRLMLKAGLIYQVASGIYSALPLAWRSLRKIENIIREEMDGAGGQELSMPALQPMELWEQSGRKSAFGDNLFALQDRRGRAMALAPTHEEVVTSIVRANVQSYRDLPVILYQIQTKFRDEARPRAGLIRVREFAMKDAYSFNADDESLEDSYQAMAQAYRNIFRRCGLPVLMAEADSGAIGGKDSHEFLLVTPTGEDTVIHCSSCQYTANAERAESVYPELPPEAEQSLEEVATPGIKTIADLAQFLDIPEAKTLKAVFYMADGVPVFVTIRGDLEVNEIKLRNALHAIDLRMAGDDEVAGAGLVAGSASAIGLEGITRVGDPSIAKGNNFVVGANKTDTHLQGANYPRDFEVDIFTDIVLAQPGQRCPNCRNPLDAVRGIEVGHIFKLGTGYSESFGASYLDNEGQQRSIIMGCYGIGVGRLLAAAIEQNHDDNGIVFPAPIAPYQVHLVGLNLSDESVAKEAESLYELLESQGVEVLFDDRLDQTAGVKLNDADLLGLPIRLIVSPRNLRNGAVEMKVRGQDEADMVAMADIGDRVRSSLLSAAL
jgi:prolyl-tRNA synthetase